MIHEQVFERDRRLRMIRERVMLNGEERLSLREAASLACLEEHYFSAYFHNKVGITFEEWRQRARIEQVKELLTSSDRSISQIAADVGYTDSASLCRFFRRRCGVTPSMFRRINQ